MKRLHDNSGIRFLEESGVFVPPKVTNWMSMKPIDTNKRTKKVTNLMEQLIIYVDAKCIHGREAPFECI